MVDEKRHKTRGKAVDYLGWYNPRDKKHQFDKEKILYWLKKGAQKTDTVHNLLINTGMIEGKKIAVHKQPKKPASAEPSAGKKEGEVPATATAPAAEAPKAA